MSENLFAYKYYLMCAAVTENNIALSNSFTLASCSIIDSSIINDTT